MRQRKPGTCHSATDTFIEVDGIRYAISRAFANRLMRDGLADPLSGALLERRRIRRAASTRYVDDPTEEGRSYKDEILSRIRQSKQNKPRVADDYTPLPFGYGLEDVA